MRYIPAISFQFSAQGGFGVDFSKLSAECTQVFLRLKIFGCSVGSALFYLYSLAGPLFFCIRKPINNEQIHSFLYSLNLICGYLSVALPVSSQFFVWIEWPASTPPSVTMPEMLLASAERTTLFVSGTFSEKNLAISGRI
jgi:hypothetical protein